MSSLWYLWNGSEMTPLDGKAADREFVVGARYLLGSREDRSQASHNHEFAWLREAWMNLPENLAHAYASPEHLRKRALIEAGYYHEDAVDCGTNAAALRVASYIRARNDFSVVIVERSFVLVRTAKSQSHRSMDKQEFEESKSKIMDIISAMIGVRPEDLHSNRAA